MSNLIDNLEKFLRSDGIRIMMDSEGIHTEAYQPLTEDDIDGFASIDLGSLDEKALESLLERAEDLQDELEGREPKEDSEEHEIWEGWICDTLHFIDRIYDYLAEAEKRA